MLLGSHLGDPGRVLAWSVTISGVIQFARLAWYLKKHRIPLPLLKPRRTARVGKLFSLMVPGVMGAGIIHINLFADIIIASLLPVGAISAVYYAERLFQLPLGVVGIAVGTALLPLMTKALAAGNMHEAQDMFNRSLEYCLFFTAPAAVALMVAHHEILTVLFQHGHYTPQDAARASPALACLAFGLPAYVAMKIFSSAYWSRQDTKTPVKISSCMAVVNIVVALIMTRFIDVAGIAFATGLAGWIQCFFLWRGLRDVEAARFDARLKQKVARIALCSALMGGAIYGVTAVFHDWFFGPMTGRLLALSILMGVSAVVYFGASHVFGVFRVGEVRKYLTRRRVARTEMIEEVTEID
jgi:putative peptidoglycan lipid II flippase